MRPALLLTILSLFLAVPSWGADYFVAPTGSDADPGTLARPFRTIGKAAAVLRPGDTCFLRAGTYRESVRPANSGEAGKPIRFAAYQGEAVTISGADPLEGRWSVHRGSIYQVETDRQFIQLFLDGRMMLEARWPNSPVDDLMAMRRANAGAGTGYEALADPNLPPGDWTGARVLIWPGSMWTNATRRVLDYQPGKGFRFDKTLKPARPDEFHQTDPYQPKAGNPYVLFGALAALDGPGEWHLDAEGRRLYLWAPAGGSPSERRVEVKQREVAFDLSARGFIELSDLSVFAAAVNMADAHDCLVENCRLRYVEHFREVDGYTGRSPQSVVTGRGNEWRRCLIAYSAGSGLRVGGENNRLTHCIIHDVNYLGTNRGGLEISRAVGAVVSHCTLFRAGRDIIQHGGSRKVRLEYNDLWNANMLNNDSGAMYEWGTDGDGGVIAYNWVHDNYGPSTVGIYLDNFSKNYVVHHNVVWNNSGTGIRLNSDSLNNLIANNTLMGNERPFGVYTYFNRVPTQKDTRIVNNLVLERLVPDDPAIFVQGALGPEAHHNGSGAVAADAVPTPDSAAVDAGTLVPGVTDGHLGRAPDLGAYELGAPRWVAGADWKDDEAPPRPPMDLAFAPRPPVTETSMVTDGLQLWLDAANTPSLQLDAQGRVLRWRDGSGKGHDALAGDPAKAPRRVPDALNGRPVVRGAGEGNLVAGTLRAEPGPVTLFIVTQSADAGGPPWQRIIGASSGAGEDWIGPNWMVLRPGGAKPEAYAARLFTITKRSGLVLDRVTLFGSPFDADQFLAGDIAEVLLFDRLLRFDESEAIGKYLSAKWGVR